MTIKAFVLDALSKFLTKLKSTYLTPMQSSINVLDDQTLISSTYADFYSKVVARANNGFTRPIMMNISGAVSSVITNSDVSVSLRGYFVISDASQMLIDGMAMDGANGYMCAFRVKLVSSSAATVQVYRSTKSQINDISTLNTNYTGLVFRKSYTYAYTNLAAGSSLNITGGDFGYSSVSGYTPLALYTINTGHPNVLIRWANTIPSSTSTMMSIRNTGSSTASGTANVGIIYIRSGAMGS